MLRDKVGGKGVYMVLFGTLVVLCATHLAIGVSFVWDASHSARVGVMPLKGGAVRWFEVTPGLRRQTSTPTRRSGERRRHHPTP
ncbi:hypothetical protein GCM10010357_24150 [Streptomyces luteireticuli]|uniref:Uncharacterized protein n=1 Tax=Streptomyces luteireticuli TaxID=173858 RepID=A0ABN0YNG1_9ACTN